VCGQAGKLPPSEAATLWCAQPPAQDASTLAPRAVEERTRDFTAPPDRGETNGAPGRLVIPGYEILEEIGRGGMGVVYKARQVKLHRVVALKMILSGSHACSEELARFRAEAEAIGQLQHPHIVQIHEVDDQDGVAYLSLEYVDGGSLAQKLASTPQPPRLAAHFLVTVARAVHAAHGHGIVHRDLKPANILLARTGADHEPCDGHEAEAVAAARYYGAPKVTDFGLAKKLDHGNALSVTGAILGTPSYMAPEQAQGKKDIGPAVDVYALGAIFYEMLTGRPPFQAATPMETVCQVVADEPVPPSRLAPRIPRDLETICLKCLHKDPGRRYGGAVDLADDLQRFLEGEPIRARPTSRAERAWKWVRRYPAAAALIAVSVVAATAFVASGIVVNARLQSALDVARARTEENRRNLVRVHVINGVHAMNEGDGFAALVWFAEALRLDEGLYDSESAHRLRIASVLRQCPKLVDLWAHQGAVRSVRVSPDGACVLAAGDDGSRLWFFDKGSSAGMHLDAGSLLRAVFSADGKRIATVSQAGEARVWDRSTGKPLTRGLRHEGLQAVSFGSGGNTLATGGGDGKVRVWTVGSERTPVSLDHPGAVADLSFSPNGRLLAVAGADGVRVWNAEDWPSPPRLLAHRGVSAIAFSNDGRLLASAGEDGAARVWAAGTGQLYAPPLHHDQAVGYVAFSPGGNRLVTAGEDGAARVWRLPAGVIQGQRLRHRSAVLHAAFSPDGCRVVTASDDNSARVWNALTGEPVSPPLRNNGTVNCAIWHPDGMRVVVAGDDGMIRVWTAPVGAHGQVTRRPGRQHGLSALPIELGSGEPSPGEAQGPVPQAAEKNVLALSPNGLLLLRPGPGFRVLVCDARTGSPIGDPLKGHAAPILHAAFSPDGTRIVTASADQTARLWDARTRAQLGEPLTHASRVTFAVFSPSGARVLTTGEDNTARVWDAGTGELLLPPMQHHGTVIQGAFSPDGARLATVCKDRTARVWDGRTGEALTPPLEHPWGVRTAAFSADGSRLVTTWPDGTETTWDLSEDDRPVEDLLRLSRLLDSRRIDLKAGTLPMDPERLLENWTTLKKRYPRSFWASKEEVDTWHENRIEEYLRNEQWAAAVWHLDRLLPDRPGDWLLPAQRGLAWAERRRWRRADRDLARSVTAGAPDVEVWCLHALLRLHAGDVKRYREVCSALLEKYSRSTDLRQAYAVAWVCVLGEKAVEDVLKPVRQGERVLAGGRRTADALAMLGLARLRAGQPEAAARRVHEAMVLRGEGPAPVEWLVLALARHRLGQTVEARPWYDRAVRWLTESERKDDEEARPPAWPRLLLVRLLRQQAEQELRVAGGKG
jgi:WD40 repeat protein